MKHAARITIFGLFLLLLGNFFVLTVHAQEDSTILSVPDAIESPTTVPVISYPPVQTVEGSVLGIGSSAPAYFTPGDPNWVIDPEVTQVGRNAERARQFIYWVVTKPPIFNAQILSQTWAITRNIAYLLIVFVIIGLALQLIIRRSMGGPTFSGISLGLDKVSLSSILIRIVTILSFVTFSYLIVLGLIQGSELLSGFFIEQLGGQDLFNIVFSSSNAEGNYDFVGYKNADPLEQDMVSTSLFLVRTTSFTYNFMGVLLILRHIILMFLLIVSPFLALLLPFIFIRNTGWVWIGEFLRWLFYGPLFALFISSLARIWKAGIPYEFAFKGNAGSKIVYQTGINILYGGPAQVLSPTNTGNYVDTYAEYIIALVMLWTAILLPWLLLKIFRDYCCDILEKNQGVLMQILDKLRPYIPPKPPISPKPSPANSFGKTMQIPESHSTFTREKLTREKIVEKINNREISHVETKDITRTYDLRVSSLKDVARFDTQRLQQTSVKETLANIQNPMRVSNPTERNHYESIRNEFTSRANRGDTLARQVIAAATPRASQIKQTIASNISHDVLQKAVSEPGKPVYIVKQHIPTIRIVSPQTVKSVSEKTHIDEKKVETILKEISSTNVFEKFTESEIKEQIIQLAKQLNIAANLISDVITAIAIAHRVNPITEITAPEFLQKIAHETHVSENNVHEIVQQATMQEIITQKERELAREERVNQISERIEVTKEQINTIIKEADKENLKTSKDTEKISSDTIREVSEKSHISQKDVEKVLEQVSSVETKNKDEQIGKIAQNTGLAESDVVKVLNSTSADQMPKGPAPDNLPAVSIEEYEEIKTMWLNHYRNAEIPKSESITSRENWLNEDVKKLTNTIELLISPNTSDRQKGMQQVGDILPFLLLGGFTDVQTLTYIKAKLEAAKLVIEESDRENTAKEKAQKELEDIEVIPAVEPKENQKADELENALELPLPESEDDIKDQEKSGASNLPGFQDHDPDMPDLPFKPTSTIIDPKKNPLNSSVKDDTMT